MGKPVVVTVRSESRVEIDLPDGGCYCFDDIESLASQYAEFRYRLSVSDSKITKALRMLGELQKTSEEANQIGSVINILAKDE